MDRSPGLDRCVEQLDHAKRDTGRRLGVCKVHGQDGEFVAAEARHHVAVAHRGAEPTRDRDQHFIADAVAVKIVDLLEAVQIEQEHAVRSAGTRWGRGRRA
jgi:hypothetical protein